MRVPFAKNSWWISFVLVVGSAAAWLVGIERQTNRKLRGEIIQLQAELSKKEKDLIEVKAAAAKVRLGNQVTPSSPAHRRHSNLSSSSDSVSLKSNENGAGTAESLTTGLREDSTRETDRAIWRMSIVKKFLPLTDEQSARLLNRLKEDGAKKSSVADLLEAEIGKESADFYRAELAKAFQRSEEESLEKEVYYLSRKLQLMPEQEAALFSAYREADSVLGIGSSGTSQSSAQRLAEHEDQRQQFLNQKFQAFLNQEQLEALANLQSQSSGRDLQTWHGE